MRFVCLLNRFIQRRFCWCCPIVWCSSSSERSSHLYWYPVPCYNRGIFKYFAFNHAGHSCISFDKKYAIDSLPFTRYQPLSMHCFKTNLNKPWTGLRRKAGAYRLKGRVPGKFLIQIVADEVKDIHPHTGGSNVRRSLFRFSQITHQHQFHEKLPGLCFSDLAAIILRCGSIIKNWSRVYFWAVCRNFPEDIIRKLEPDRTSFSW